MPSTLDTLSALPRRHRRHGLARWWLAGLLVSCLLPASLHPSDLRSSDRSVCICFWVPAMLRAQSQWIAKKRRALRRWVARQQRQLPVLKSFISFFSVMPRQTVALDVCSPRGPPAR
ncbi:hypothetical protein CWI66_02065 [Halomonas sp. 141]|uniref:hypothetical protein n=1 Tax=unclassified Halomonas TaxID=2609666 RepID=UPI0009C0F31E|nr:MULTISPECIES: hypothetical protein [unclassified Halomonas]PJX15469.1 hypothetical protein CWI66_02065 [Halomonas sp. 141]